jgi:hypothetical protein
MLAHDFLGLLWIGKDRSRGDLGFEFAETLSLSGNQRGEIQRWPSLGKQNGEGTTAPSPFENRTLRS